jgi:diaminopimelate decarboxylase
MYFTYSEDTLFWQGYSLTTIHEQVKNKLNSEYQYNGPYYLYSEKILRDKCSLLEEKLPNATFYYSCKALSNLSLLKVISKYGNFGIDVVSKGELIRAMKAGFSTSSIVFAGVGKTKEELEFALENKIYSFHIESLDELILLNAVARNMKTSAHVALRLNPEVEVDTHAYITTGNEKNKFGLSKQDFSQLINTLDEFDAIELKGLQAHVGSQIKEIGPYINTLKALNNALDMLPEKISSKTEYLSLGGGFGIDYENVLINDSAFSFPFEELQDRLKQSNKNDMKLCFEPGRQLTAECGCLITNTLYIKNKKEFKYAIIDTGMTDLIRPALYNSQHKILPFMKKENRENFSIAGPICESSDEFVSNEKFPQIEQGDLLCISNTGAYGSVMGSNFNSRPYIPEMLIRENKSISVIRRPQSYEELLQLEDELL